MNNTVRDFDHGGDIIRPADGAVTGRWWRLQAIESATLAVACDAEDLAGSLASIVLAPGVEIRATWRTVAISTGVVVAYR
jgi:hypothetical protein